MMFRYRNEAEFSRACVATMKKYGWFVQRIETGSTGRGVPDIYAISPHNEAYWIELKRVHGRMPRVLDVPWRPGQQAWLHTVTRKRQQAVTLVCYDNLVCVIRHKKTYPGNKVTEYDTADRLSAIFS